MVEKCTYPVRDLSALSWPYFPSVPECPVLASVSMLACDGNGTPLLPSSSASTGSGGFRRGGGFRVTDEALADVGVGSDNWGGLGDDVDA